MTTFRLAVALLLLAGAEPAPGEILAHLRGENGHDVGASMHLHHGTLAARTPGGPGRPQLQRLCGL